REPRPLRESPPGGERSIEPTASGDIPDDDVAIAVGGVRRRTVRRQHRTTERQVAGLSEVHVDRRAVHVPDEEPRIVPDGDHGPTTANERDADRLVLRLERPAVTGGPSAHVAGPEIEEPDAPGDRTVVVLDQGRR